MIAVEEGTVVTVGTFDGMHRGHAEVLHEVGRIAVCRGLRPLAVTFDRHPLETIAPDRAPALIMTADERDALIRREGVAVERVAFTDGVRHKTAAEWMRELVDRYSARVLVLGYDNKFGSDGHSMTFGDFRRTGAGLGIDVVMAPEVGGCSSTAVRNAVKSGDMAEACRILGRPFTVGGTVVSGRRLGRTIGVPTANLEVGPRQLMPASGVYSADVEVGGLRYPAVVNVGDNPTVSDSGRIRIEAHLLDFDGDLYGREVKVEFGRRIRGEMKFDSLDALKNRIAEDIAQVLSARSLKS